MKLSPKEISGLVLIWLLSAILFFAIGKEFGSENTQVSQDGESASSSERKEKSDSNPSHNTSSTKSVGKSGKVSGKSKLSKNTKLSVLQKSLRRDFLAALDEKNRWKRRQKLHAIISKLDKKGIQDVLGMIDSLPERHKQHLIYHIMGRWGEVDPKGALDYIDNNIKYKRRAEWALRRLLGGWAKADPDKAWEWINSNKLLEDSYNFDEYNKSRIMGFASGAAENDIEMGISVINDIEDEAKRNQMYHQLCRSMYWRGKIAEMAEFIISNPSDNLDTEALLPNSLGMLAREDPEKALSLLDEIPKSQTALLAKIQSDIARRWSRRDPAASAEWLEELPDNPDFNKSKALAGITGNWFFYDPESASDWVNKQTPSPEFDASFSKAVGSILKLNPEQALIWANSISNDKMREKALERVKYFMENGVDKYSKKKDRWGRRRI